MKKAITILSVLLCFSLLFSACMQDEPDPSVHLGDTDPATIDPINPTTLPIENPTEPPTENPTDPPTEPPTSPPKILPTQPTDPETGLPVYVPGSLELMGRDHGMTPVNREYRFIYYNMWGEFIALRQKYSWVDNNAWFDEYCENYRNGQYEMILVSLVRYYNIPREEFDKAVEEFIANHSVGEMMTEYYEVPNADIIYTFDDEIINEYYRYE